MSNITKSVVKVPVKTPRKSWKKFLAQLGLAVAAGVITKAQADVYYDRVRNEGFQEGVDIARNLYSNPYAIGEPSPPRLSGRGRYRLRDFGTDVASGIGVMGGGYLGGPIGAAVGGSLGREIGGAMFGRGDYKVAVNSIGKSGSVLPEGSTIPEFAGAKFGTRIKHREFIRDILCPAVPATFTNLAQAINPGNPGLFPWLSQVAPSYSQYEFQGLVFHFKTTTSDYATGGALGTMIMATNYDVLEANYSTKVVMENSQYAVSAKPSLSQIHCIECDPATQVTKLHYIRDSTSSTTSSQDNRFYDIGNFQVATSGLSTSAGTVLGELWVSYDIVLYKPEIVPPASFSQKVVGAGTVSNAAVFGSAAIITGNNIVAASGSTLTWLTDGEYIMQFIVAGTGLVSSTDTGTVTASELWQEYAAAGTSGSITYRIRAVAGQTLTLDHTASTTVTSTALRVAPYKFSLA